MLLCVCHILRCLHEAEYVRLVPGRFDALKISHVNKISICPNKEP